MKIVVNNTDSIRIDKYLAQELDYSREFIQKLIADKLILVNGKEIKSSFKTELNDIIEINANEYEEQINITPTKMNLNIVYEDDFLMIINKPSGLVVHPGSGNYTNTLVNGLLYYTNNLSDIGGDVRPGIVHRIDKDTSGLLLVAKTNKAHEILSDDFKNKRIKREYIALLNGVFKNESATIDAPIGRDKLNREKMCVTDINSKKAITNMKVINRFNKYTLVSCILETGRTHQIRVHMAYIGHPIVGDSLYGTKSNLITRQALHACKVSFVHPISKKHVNFESAFPQDMQLILQCHKMS